MNQYALFYFDGVSHFGFLKHILLLTNLTDLHLVLAYVK